jgi:clumping factor A
MLNYKLWTSLVGVILMAAIVATTTTSTSAVYADSDLGKNKDLDVGTETELGNEEAEDTTDDTTEDDTTESDEETQEQTTSASSSQDELSQDNPGNGDTQSGRVGSHDDGSQTSGEGANGGGTVTDPTITGDPDVVDEGDTVKADCFGKVISHEAQEHKEDPDEGTLGEHSSDPVPELEGNETPRQGIGNQDQGHPAAHGAFNSQFEEEDAENVEENC